MTSLSKYECGEQEVMEISQEHIERVFHARDVRCTRQREVVYRALASTDQHPTAEELHRLVAAVDPKLSLATVYNTLEILEEARLCRRVASTAGAARFDADMDVHVHVVMADGRVLDLPEKVGKRVMEAVKRELGEELDAAAGGPFGRFTVQVVASGG